MLRQKGREKILSRAALASKDPISLLANTRVAFSEKPKGRLVAISRGDHFFESPDVATSKLYWVIGRSLKSLMVGARFKASALSE
jgi:hypothetical protein